MKPKTLHLVTLFVILALTLGACRGSEEPTPTPSPTQEPTAMFESTATLEPTPTPIQNPSPRGFSMMAHDAESNRVILFGGVETGALLKKGTWSYDFSTITWRRMKPKPSPRRSDGHMAYDAESDRVILFIGSILYETGNYFDLEPGSETWTYDFDTDTWTNMEPVEAPYGLRGTRMVYDVESDRIILFGGWVVGNSTAGGAFNETWTYDYNTNTWTKMEPEVSPPGRNYHAMAYDDESDRVILWGGDGPVPVDVSSVWAYDYNTDTWEELESSGAPSPIAYGAMVYTTAADRIILYAGLEFWSFDYNTNTWTQLSDSPLPGELSYHAMVYSGEADRVILFGGGLDDYSFGAKTWVYDLNTNTWTDVSRR